MADWDRSDVYSLTPSMHPPGFMWMGEDETYNLEEEKYVIRQHYDRAVDILNGGEGYDSLMGMKERLESHRTRAEEATSGYENRRNYARSRHAIMWDKISTIAEKRSDEDAGKAIDRALNSTMGAHFRDEDGNVKVNGPEEVWHVVPSVATFHPDEHAHSSPRGRLRIRFKPERCVCPTDFDEDEVHETDRRTFDGSETWREALDSIRQRLECLQEQYERAVNTKELLRFRLGVIETVLYRFEAYGSVDEMSDTEAQSVVDRDLPDLFSGRPTLRNHAERLVKKYRQRSTSLPDGMEAFKEWVPDGENATGRSIVARLQSAYREEGVSDRYDDPESFCDLVRRLLEKHFDERSETF